MPNQINEDELQKAIDDITNSAQNNADAGEMPAEAPAEAPAPAEMAAPEASAVPDGAAPMPDFGTPPVPPVPPTPGAFDPSTVTPLGAPAPAPMPEMPPVAEAPAAPAPAPVEEAPMIAPPEGTPEAVVAPVMGEMPAEAPAEAPAPAEMTAPEADTDFAAAPEAPEIPEMDAGASQIKADILRDLSPLMDKVEIEPEKKFHIYKDMMTTNNDKSVIPSAYETAKLIGDEQKRGEALVSLIDAIDS